MVRGTVKTWDAQTGLGVISSPDLPGDVLAEQTSLRGRSTQLSAGDVVLFDYVETTGSPSFRAVWVKARAVA